MKKQIITILKAISIPVLLIIIWLLVAPHVPPMILPTLPDTLVALQELIANGEMIAAWRATMYRITTATLMSVGIALPLALLSRSFKTVKEIITPFTNFMRYIPVTIFYPLLIIWLGIDESMRIGFLFIATFFVFFPAVMLILENIDKNLIERALTSGANKIKMLWYVYLPAALPAICKVFLSLFSVGFTFMIIGESINTRHGLGYLMLIGSARGRTPIVFAAILVTIITGALIDIIGKFLIKKIFKWTKGNEVSS